MHLHTSVPLPTALADAAAALDTLLPSLDAETAPLARLLLERLRRDLLPRLSSEAPLLLAAIAGPNNVGKSTLFNALAAERLSPAHPEGGLTKQCLAVAHPSTASGAGLQALARRYSVVDVPAGAHPPVDVPGPVGRLYLAQRPQLPRGLVLLDTPDLDSVVSANRERTEALLVTVDVLVFVVSRHTYQNAALVAFLREAVAHGRPWLVLYNEATDKPLARAHLEKLTRDVGQPPLARFVSPHDAAVEQGTAPLRPEPLDGGPGLADLLADPVLGAQLRKQALKASLQEARETLGRVRAAVLSGAAEPARLRARVRDALFSTGAQAALHAVPADILVEAFREELDARSRLHRWVRTPFRGLAMAVSAVGRRVRRSFTGESRQASLDPAREADRVLREGLGRLLESLAPELSAWTGDVTGRRLLETALGEETLAALRASEPLVVADTPADREALHSFCRALVRKELPGGFAEGAMQTLATLVYSVPAGAAAVVTVAFGGLGQDAALWAGTLLSTPLMERFVDALGTGIRRNVSLAWADQHGKTLALALETRFFHPLLAHLDAQLAEASDLADRLQRAAEAISAEGVA
ncbi:MAG: GTPase [Myxococcaceae bacterium]